MADKSNNMNPHGLPPDSDLLLSYLKREMSNAEKHELEKRMLADDFLADAAEGLTAVNNPLIIADITAQINAKVNAPAAKPGVPKRSPLAVVGNTLAVAASVGLLVVAAWFISQSVSNKKSLTVADSGIEQKKNANAPVTEQLEPAPVNTIAGDSLAADETVAPVKPDFTKAVRNYRYENVSESNAEGDAVAPAYYNAPPVEDAPAVNSTTATGAISQNMDYNTTINTNNIYDKYGPASNTNNGYYKTPILEKAKDRKNTAKSPVTTDSISDTWGNRTALSEEDSPGEYVGGVLIKKERDDATFNTGAEQKPGTKVSEANGVTSKTKTNTDPASPSNKALARGLEKYNKGEYRSATNDLEDAVKADPNNFKAQYSLAMAYKNTNKPDNALKVFSKIPTTSSYYENAQWEIANIYLNKNEDDKCIVILKKIVKLNGAYKIRAQNMIDNLEEQKPAKPAQN